MDYHGLEIGMKAFNLSQENNVQIEWRQDIASDNFGVRYARFRREDIKLIHSIGNRSILR
jgi:hypothetical protein